MKNNKLFRLLSLIIGTIMIMATLPMVTVGAADAPVIHEHENMNVALGKPVYCGKALNLTAAQRLTDGSTSNYIYPSSGGSGYASGTVSLPSGETVTAATSQGDDWFIVDLGRRYTIDRVRLVGRDASHYRFMQYFNIEASNEANFASYVKLGGRGSTTVAVAEYETAGDGNAYRYVRIRKTGSSEYGYRELEVYADVTTHEVSRGAKVSTIYTNNLGTASSTVTDGVTNNDSTGILFEGNVYNSNEPPYNVQVDLGAEYPIGLIEMWGRGNENGSYTGATGYRNNWIIYGASEANTPTSSQDTENASQILTITSAYPASGLKRFTTVGNYRYLTFSKTTKEIACIGEIRAEVVLPKVTEATIESNTQVKVSFSEKMNIDTLNSDGAVTLTTDGGTIYKPQSITLTDASTWDGGYDAVLTFSEKLPSELLTLNVDENVKTIDGAVFTLDTQVYVGRKTVAINKTYSAVKTDVNIANNKPVYNALESVDGSVLTNGVYQEGFGISESTYPETAPDITLPSGDVVKGATGYDSDWYIVDLGNRYNIKQIRLYAAGSNYGFMANWMSGVALDVSNDITFAEKRTVGSLGDNSELNVVTSSKRYFEVNLDGENAYRYVKIRKTSGDYYYYGELEVYADVMTTEVSRGASAEATKNNEGTSYDLKYVTDGSSSGTYGWYLGGSYVNPNNLVIDLGADYPLDMVQIYKRTGSSYDATTVYGANLFGYGYSSEEGKPSLDDKPTNPVLFRTLSGFTTTNFKKGFKRSDIRYFVISKQASETFFISEVRALVTNPEVNKVTVNDNSTITVSFSDKIDPAALVASNFTIDGVTLSNPTFATGWDGYYDVTFNYSGEIATGMTLTVDESVKNQNGIEMAADAVIVLEKDTFTVTCGGVTVEELTANASHSVTAKIASPEGTDAVLYVAVKLTDGTFVSCAKSEATTIAAGDTAEITVEGITPKSGEVIYIYLWEDETLIPIVEDLLVK